MPAIKNKMQYIVIVIALCILAAIFYDYIIDNIAGAIMAVLSLFGVAAANEKRKEMVESRADEHEEIADEYLASSVNELERAKEAHKNAHEASDITTPNYNNLPDGFKRKTIRSR